MTNPSAAAAPTPGGSHLSTFLHGIFAIAGTPLLRSEFLAELTKRLFHLFECERVELFFSEASEELKLIRAARDAEGFVWEFLPLPSAWNEACLPAPSGAGHPGISDPRREALLRELLRDDPSMLADEDQSLWISLAGGSRTMGMLRIVWPRHRFREEELNQLSSFIGFAVDHRLLTLQLRERVKELTCLYGIAHIAVRPSLSLDDILAEIVRLLPDAWLYPECATARIIIDDQEFALENWRRGAHVQSCNIILNGLNRGRIEVAYLETKPDLDEGPFLREERWLIETIAHEISLILQRGQAEDENKNRLLNQIRHADRLATFGLLAAGVAHEINEPLGNILGFAQLIQKDRALNDQTARDTDKIIAATLRAREVMQKLMLFARQMPPKKVRVDLNEIVREGLTFLDGRLIQSGITLSCNLSPEIPPITADPAQLYQVLVNLVVNAIQAMPDGGTLTIETKLDDGRIVLTVEDVGIGMTEETLKQIFIPFFTTKNVGEGTGLGLSVAHGIVTAHGGTISATSRPGEGSVFTIILPGQSGRRLVPFPKEPHD